VGAPGADVPRVPLVWVDAFADGPFTGNPAAVCLLDRPAGEAAMQSLAFELGLSETAFVWPEGTDFGLRWFTPLAEVDLCGHATVAAARALYDSGRLRTGRARFTTNSGLLEATVDGEEVEIDLPAEVASPVGVPPSLRSRVPAVRAATGRFDLLVELEDEDAVRRVDPATLDLGSLPYRGIAFSARGGTPVDHRAVGERADYVLRFFAPRVGVPEDPVTGSAQCLLGPYWADALGRSTLRAVQLSGRGGTLRVRVGGRRSSARAGDGRVGVAGRTSTVLAGHVTGEAASRLLGSR
jgi:predicted PhzF superfamily epimerase YddE/YHI9